ncbi:hypothetical protein [Gordonia araii]|uniref:hypothetical protein n=1 Tax=Gordonia araii TaxID=263909 RepID=UPI0011103EF0|nr:hypothetical protein [Gordonia araii]NNG97134.1 hypothetical protein [Gordonia araii NBRC 100433]
MTIILFTSACSSTDQGGDPKSAGPLSSCDATAPTGKTTTLETESSNGRTVEVKIPLLPEWGRPIGSGIPQPGGPTPGLGKGSRVDRSGAWVMVDAEIDFEPPTPVDDSPRELGFWRLPRPSPIPPEELGISIDDDRNGTVCGQEAHLLRQHPTRNGSQAPYVRGELTITCSCGGDTPVIVVVKVDTHERRPPIDTRSTRNDGPPPHPSLFESEIALILANVQVGWENE